MAANSQQKRSDDVVPGGPVVGVSVAPNPVELRIPPPVNGIWELPTSPEITRWVQDKGPEYRWDGKIAVELKWVAAARPSKLMLGADGTDIAMAGGSAQDTFFTVGVPYSRFMEEWLKVKDVRR